jgi:hypothetical protein
MVDVCHFMCSFLQVSFLAFALIVPAADAADGEVRVELQEANGRAIEVFHSPIARH